MTKNEAITKLKKVIGDIANLYDYDWQSPELKKWQRETQIALKKIFDDNQHLQDFEKIRFIPVATSQEQYESKLTRTLRYKNAVRQGLNTAKAILESMIDEINDYWKDEIAQSEPLQNGSDWLWSLLHPAIAKISRTLFESNHYADSVLAAMREVNVVLKEKVKILTGEEFDGAKLMQKTFSTDNPILLLGDVDTQTGKDLQQGYQQIFSGAIIGIRNPKAHENLTIDENRAIHLLFLASLLMHKIDDAKKPKAQIQNQQVKGKSAHLDKNKEAKTKPEVSITFENDIPYIENTYYSDNGQIDKKIRILVTNQSSSLLGLETFLVLDTKPLEDIPVLSKDSPHSTFNLPRGGRQFIDIAEYKAANKMIRFNTLPIYLQNSVITLENNQKFFFTIKILGQMEPCIKRFSFYTNDSELQIEDIN